MVALEDFWGAISEEVKEYLAMRYYSTTRCLLSIEQVKIISEREISFMKKQN